MGLFKKKASAEKVTELMALRTELDDLRMRLEAAEWAKNITDSRLSALDATTSVLANITSSGESAPDVTPRLTELETMLATVQARLDAPPSSTLTVTPLAVSPAMPSGHGADADTTARLEALAQRMNAIDELNGQMGQLAERVTANDHTARQAAEQVNALDQRVSNIGTELANQISELGNDIDALAGRSGSDGGDSGPAVSDEVIEALRTGQARLANEQARYEIAFRQDLATLAEQVRRPTAR